MISKKNILLKAAIVLMLVIAVLCAVTALAAEDTRGGYYVELRDGNTAVALFTRHTNVKDVLAQADVKINELDSLDLSNFIPGEDSVITVKRSNLVGVSNDDGTVFFTFNGTVDEAVKASDVPVSEADVLNYDRGNKVKDGMIINVSKAIPVTVEDHGEKFNVEVSSGTVGEVLDTLGVNGTKQDVISHSVDEAVTSGMTIKVDEVTYKERVENEVVKFNTTEKKDSTLEEGKREVITKGVNGENKVTYKDKYVNGVLSGSEKIDTQVVKEPVNEVVKVGTRKEVPTFPVSGKTAPISDLGTVPVDENGVPLSYTGVVSGKATAYYGGWGTASGRPVRVGHVAVDPRKIPYGTKLYIVATDGTVYGYAIAADTGGFIERGDVVVDVYMNTYEECCQWGLKNVNMYILP